MRDGIPWPLLPGDALSRGIDRPCAHGFMFSPSAYHPKPSSLSICGNRKYTDRVHDILCTTWPSARIFDSPKSQHSGSEIEEIISAMPIPVQPPAAGLPSLKCFIKEIWTRTRSSRAVLWLARKYLEVCRGSNFGLRMLRLRMVSATSRSLQSSPLLRLVYNSVSASRSFLKTRQVYPWLHWIPILP